MLAPGSTIAVNRNNGSISNIADLGPLALEPVLCRFPKSQVHVRTENTNNTASHAYEMPFGDVHDTNQEILTQHP